MQPSTHPQKTQQKKTKTLEFVYKELNRDFVQIKKKEKKCNNDILKMVLDEILNLMRERDPLFCSMRPKIEYLGSYYDGLRVGQPTEYDLNLLLKLPVNYKKIILDSTKTHHEYTSIVMHSEFRRLSKTPETAIKGFKKTLMWCDSNYRLSLHEFRKWMQSVVDTALAPLPLKDGKRILSVKGKCYRLSATISGPANTITIITENNKLIDVDLVPTFGFYLPQKPIGSQVLFERVCCTNINQYFVVPKPSGDDYSWRLAFPFQERYYISKKNNLKSTVKLLKLLRDVQGFKDLASYFIKTLFLWETNEKQDNFWKKHSLAYLFLYMLKKLKDSLAVGEIKSFWCPNHNLIADKIQMETCINWSNRLSFIINEIEKKGKSNPYIVRQFFTK